MKKTATITINGKLYDAVTGAPVVAPHSGAKQAPQTQHGAGGGKPFKAFSDVGPRTSVQSLQASQENAARQRAIRQEATAQNIHATPQKSTTLHRKAVKKPTVLAVASTPSTARSPQIQKFAPTTHTEATVAATQHSESQEGNVTAMHPAVARALQQQAAKNAPAAPAQTSKELKEALIKEQLAKVGSSPKEHRSHTRQKRLATILASSLAVLLLGGYLTYMTLPSISMKVAASRAGVNAEFPSYKPDGYSLSGPISYSPGQVTINYQSNTNANNFKITQKASNWNSQAVLDNYVSKQSDTYLTFQERGMTIYSFGNKAAWVNGGLLYTIEGSANLSSDQILRVAASM